jgi:uncharacterized protein (TIGR02996 family)
VDEREALIQTIIDNPNDDTARLVFADWQEEHGQAAHAELIRAQLAGTPEGNARAAELLARPEFASVVELGNTFERGFVTNARGYEDVRDDPEVSDYLEKVPLDRVLFVNCCDYGGNTWLGEDEARQLAAHPVARRVRLVRFFEWSLSGTALRELARSPHLLNLRDVVFNASSTEEAALAELLLAPSVRGVERVLLTGDNDWSGFAEPLARVLADPRAAHLRLLSVTSDFTAGSLADTLLAAPDLPNLRLHLPRRAEWLTAAVRAALEARYGARLTFADHSDPYTFVPSNSDW